MDSGVLMSKKIEHDFQCLMKLREFDHLRLEGCSAVVSDARVKMLAGPASMRSRCIDVVIETDLS